ncbi:hypothetical protein J1N35_010982 [Gossypium stocksii]|uniref:Uncharacterized protein n=1 Tax=Gossypium stocksii TaxID=47602 RepID=A0A9D3W1E1_9ROSI|nr:hypothetical protein J1N35_010982 [Gossypium stocksii]
MFVVRVRGKGKTYLVHDRGALMKERIFPNTLEYDIKEQRRLNQEEHTRSTVLVGERGEEAMKEIHFVGVVMEASSHSSQQSRPNRLQEHSMVAFKGNICLDSLIGSLVGRPGVVGHQAVQEISRTGWGKSSGNRQGKKLNKIIRDKGSPVKASSSIFSLAESMAVRDSNAILSESDKKGGSIVGRHRPYFGEFIESKGLQDLGFRGSSFTWQKGGTFERLIRALGNLA